MSFGTSDILIGTASPWHVVAVHAAEIKEVQHGEKDKDQGGPQAPFSVPKPMLRAPMIFCIA